jgi:amino acid transporter
MVLRRGLEFDALLQFHAGLGHLSGDVVGAAQFAAGHRVPFGRAPQPFDSLLQKHRIVPFLGGAGPERRARHGIPAAHYVHRALARRRRRFQGNLRQVAVGGLERRVEPERIRQRCFGFAVVPCRVLRHPQQRADARGFRKQRGRLFQHRDGRIERVMLDQFEGQREAITLARRVERHRRLIRLGGFHVLPALVLDVAGQGQGSRTVAAGSGVGESIVESASLQFGGGGCQQESRIGGREGERGPHFHDRVCRLAQSRRHCRPQAMERDPLRSTGRFGNALEQLAGFRIASLARQLHRAFERRLGERARRQPGRDENPVRRNLYDSGSVRQPDSLTRGIGLLGATSANMLEMIGVGPFITIPILLSKMNGPQAMLGWLLGALVALCDGMVWAELGAAMPDSGGPYHYLSEAYGPRGMGRMMSFLFIWQTIFLTPLSIGSGAVGFAQYARFFARDMSALTEKSIAMGVCLVITFLVYRDIRAIGRLSVVMWVVVLGTVAWITVAGVLHFDPKLAFDFPAGAFTPSRAFFFGLGGATLIAMYDYGGYNNVCFFAGEVRRPEKVIPRSILISIGAVAALYLTMNVAIIGVVPWREAVRSTSIVSDLIRRLYGSTAAAVATVLVLWTTLASVFAVLLGCSRVPYAAAVDGRFFGAFARLHPRQNFPSFSVLFLGICAALASLMNLDVLINGLIVIQVMIQFIAQVFAVTLIRRNRPDIVRPFRMPLYPLTSAIALLGWLYILIASGVPYIAAGFGLLLVGMGAYFWRARRAGEWPFDSRELHADA